MSESFIGKAIGYANEQGRYRESLSPARRAPLAVVRTSSANYARRCACHAAPRSVVTTDLAVGYEAAFREERNVLPPHLDANGALNRNDYPEWDCRICACSAQAAHVHVASAAGSAQVQVESVLQQVLIQTREQLNRGGTKFFYGWNHY